MKNYVIGSVMAFVVLAGGLVYTILRLNQIDRDVKHSDNSQYIISTLSEQIKNNCNATTVETGNNTVFRCE
jgi:hypothetical protein